MKWPEISLTKLIVVLESGSRPPGGATTDPVGVPSIGGEHLDADGGFRLGKLKFIPREHYDSLGSGQIQQFDTLVVKDGATTGKTSFIGKDFPLKEAAVNEHVFIVRPDQSKANPRFVFYFLFSSSGQIQIKRDHRGATIGGISRGFTDMVQIPLPPLSEQRRIVEILDQADALRKKRAEADKKAERILPALFYKMFGDPATNPKGWPVVPIREKTQLIDRRDPGQQPDATFLYIDISGINGESGTIVEARKLLGAEAPSRARQIVQKNDVIISTVRPYLRATALVPEDYHNQICSTGFCILRAKEDRGFGFLYTLSRLQWFTDQLNSRARGASYPAVTDRDILDLRAPCPDEPELHRNFDDQIETLLALQAKRNQAHEHLELLFSSLLHRAFSGDLTAQWREAHMKELLAEMEEQVKALSVKVES